MSKQIAISSEWLSISSKCKPNSSKQVSISSEQVSYSSAQYLIRPNKYSVRPNKYSVRPNKYLIRPNKYSIRPNKYQNCSNNKQMYKQFFFIWPFIAETIKLNKNLKILSHNQTTAIVEISSSFTKISINFWMAIEPCFGIRQQQSPL